MHYNSIITQIRRSFFCWNKDLVTLFLLIEFTFSVVTNLSLLRLLFLKPSGYLETK